MSSDFVNDLIKMSKSFDSSTAWGQNLHPDFSPSWYYETQRKQPSVSPIQIETSQTAYKQTAVTWNLERLTSGGKLKVQQLTQSFMPNMLELYKENGEIKFARLFFQASGTIHSALMSGDDYLNGRFDKVLRMKITKLPGCKPHQLNDLVGWLLQTVPTAEIECFSTPGWHACSSGRLVYAAFDPSCGLPEVYVPRAVRRRILRRLTTDPQTVVSRWKALCAKDPALLFFLYFAMTGCLSWHLKRAGVRVRQYVTAIPSKGCDEQQLIAILATNDTDNFPVCDLASGDVERELSESRCGTALFVNHGFADDNNKVVDNLKKIIRAKRGDTEDDLQHNAVFVISQNAALAAKDLDPECLLVIDTEGINIKENAETLREIVSAMQTLLIQKLYEIPMNEVVADFKAVSAKIHDHWRDSNPLLCETISSLCCIERLLTMLFNSEPLLNDIRYLEILPLLQAEGLDKDRAVIGEVGIVMSRMFRAGELHPVRKKRGLYYQMTDQTVFVDGAWMWLSPSAREKALSQMTTIGKERTLNRVLQGRGKMKCTDGCVDPIDVRDISGKSVHLRWYAFSVDLLEDDIVQRLSNLESEDYWLRPDEVPKEGFLRLLTDSAGRVAGVQITHRVLENHGVYFSGISGSGKTTGMASVASEFNQLGDRVIWLDSCGSASTEALSETLTPGFVDKNVDIHDIDQAGVPVNLFCAEKDLSSEQMSRRLLDVLSAASGDLSEVQADTLESIVMKMADSRDMTAIRTADILEELNSPGTSFSSLRTRLKPVLQGIERCGMADATWNDYLASHSRFLVIRVEDAFGENTCSLFDAIIFSLFNWQRRHKDLPLHIVMDEVHLQNLSSGGAIRKVTAEGRKYQMSLCAASQDYPARGTDLGTAMGNVPTRVILRPTLNSASAVAEYLNFTKGQRSQLDEMRTGEAIVRAYLYNKSEGRNIQATVRGKIYRGVVQDKGSNPTQCLSDSQDGGGK